MKQVYLVAREPKLWLSLARELVHEQKEEDGKTLVCDKRNKAITYVFFNIR